jgi:hypothetical protein
MVHSSLGNVADEVEDNTETLLSPDPLWRAPGNRLYTLREVGVGTIAGVLQAHLHEAARRDGVGGGVSGELPHTPPPVYNLLTNNP